MEAVQSHSPPPDALVAFALTLTNDSVLAEALAREAAARSEDLDERRHFIERRVEEHRRQHAAQRLSAWKSLKPRAGLLALPVILAFAVGLAGGTGLGLARVPQEPSTLEPGAAPLNAVFGNTAMAEWKHATSKQFTFTAPERTALLVTGAETGDVEARVNGAALRGQAAERVVPLDALRAGGNVLEYRGKGTWSIAAVRLEPVTLPATTRDGLIAAAAEQVKAASALSAEEVAGRYRTWKLLRDAKVFLEGAPGGPTLEVAEVRARLALAADALNTQCTTLLDAATRAEPAAARLVLDTLEDEFPEPSSACRLQAEKLKGERGL